MVLAALAASVLLCSSEVSYNHSLPKPKTHRIETNPLLGREGVFLRDRADIIKMRMMAVRSKQCASQKNKYYCPEVFLDVVADKLTATAVLFLNVELLSEFYYNFPRELDMRLGRHLSDEEVERFAREDPRVRRHLDIIRKKELLELALQKIEGIRQLDGRSMHRNSDRTQAAKETRSRWNIF